MAAVAQELDFRVAWEPNPGSQVNFLTCPAFECMYSGSRGVGKSELLLADFATGVGRGWGQYWVGIIFRREYKHLDDLVKKSTRLFKTIFPEARFLKSGKDYKWVWPSGEELLFRAASKTEDYWDYHGHEYPWMGFDELTNWPDGDLFDQLVTLCRSSAPFPDMPRKIRSTTNPWGAGHSWVKDRYVDHGPPGVWIMDGGVARTWVHGTVYENLKLLEFDPLYIERLKVIPNPELRKAWLLGDWDVNPGGFLAGVWDRRRHVIAPHPIPLHWVRWRACDWGTNRPFSIGWYAKNPDGNIIRYRELYGWNGKANQGAKTDATTIARVINKIESQEIKQGVRFLHNPADADMWANRGIRVAGQQITPASLMWQEGVEWSKVEKGPGSRRAGASVIVDLLQNDRFQVWNNCRHFLRTVPSLAPNPMDWEDVDTEQEDHVWDEFRYALTMPQLASKNRARREAPLVGSMDWLLKHTDEVR